MTYLIFIHIWHLWDSKIYKIIFIAFTYRAARGEHTQDSILKENRVMTGRRFMSVKNQKHVPPNTHSSSSTDWVWLPVMESHDFLDNLTLIWIFFMPNPNCAFISSKHHVKLAATDFFWPLTDTYPALAAFWGLLLWNSISSTVHTAPFTFSSRTKHLWRLRLCLTAF